MKKRSAVATGLLLFFFVSQASAQSKTIPLHEPDYNKPKLFADLPQRMTMRTKGIDALFGSVLGSSVSYRLSDTLLIEGTVVSKSEAQNPQMESVVIRSTNRGGATFTVTRTAATNGSFSYIGRIVSRNNGDAFEIRQEGGQYVLAKKDLYDLLSE